MRCLGVKGGTGCKKVSRNPYAINWTRWQLCHDCALILHAIEYKGQVRRGTGGKFLKESIAQSMITQ